MASDLKEEEPAILRSELGKLIRIARILRPGAIYDASAEVGAFSEGELSISHFESGAIANTDEEENAQKEIRSDFEQMPGCHDFFEENRSNANKVNFLKKI